MEPCSILELSSTVLKLCSTVYEFLKALYNAPAEVLEYLDALEKARKVFLDVQEYAEAHEQSTLMSVDGMQLATLRAVLEDCEIILTEQQSCLERFPTGDHVSRFQAARIRFAFVLSREALRASTTKLMVSQALLAQAIMTSTGKNTVFIRDAVNSIALDVEHMRSALVEEEDARQRCLGLMKRYTRELHDGIGMLMGFAHNTGIQSTTRLDHITNTMDTQFAMEAEQHELGDLSRPRTNVNTVSGAPSDDTESHESRPSQNISNNNYGKHFVDPDTNTGVTHMKKSWQQFLDGFPAEELKILSVRAATHGLDDDNTEASHVLSKDKAQASRLKHVIGAFTLPMDSFFGSRGMAEFGYLMTQSLKMIATANKKFFDDMLSVLEETGDVLTVCSRELELYRNNERIGALMAEVYGMFLCLVSRLYRDSYREGRFSLVAISSKEPIKKQVAAIRQVSERLMWEVDYQHRLEMRESSRKIADMHIQQQQIAQMLREQKLLVESLQQERQIMKLVQQQQKILATVQMIQQTMQSQAS